MARERQVEEVPDDNTYLVCPLSDDEVEAIRAEAYKLREENTLQETEESSNDLSLELERGGESRGTGELHPDSGISVNDAFWKEQQEFVDALNDPLLSTQFVRRELYWQLNKEQMQGAVARYYGWEKWSEDPWGSYPKFCEWISNAHDNEMAVWAVNETSRGRSYLVYSILEGLEQLECSKMTEEDLFMCIGYGDACFFHARYYTGWEDWSNHYPQEPLPVRLVNERVSKVYPFDRKFPYSGMTFPLPVKPDGSLDIPEQPIENPFVDIIEDILTLFIREYGPLAGYRFLVSGIYLWAVAWPELSSRLKGHPKWVSLIGYKSASKPSTAALAQKLTSYDLPGANFWWEEIDRVTKEFQKILRGRYRRRNQPRLELIDVDIPYALNNAIHDCTKQPLKKLKVLAFSLERIIESNMINTLEKEDPQFAELRKAYRKAQRRIKPTSQIEKANLLERIKEQRDNIGTKEPVKPSDKELVGLIYRELTAAKAPLSLDREFEDEDGDSYCLGDMIEDKRAQGAPEQMENRELLNAINEKLSPRECLVMRLTSEGESDEDIALALENTFGKSSSEESVRKLRQRARDTAKQVRDEMGNS